MYTVIDDRTISSFDSSLVSFVCKFISIVTRAQVTHRGKGTPILVFWRSSSAVVKFRLVLQLQVLGGKVWWQS